jgi:NitT/TauT family transport system permease protein
MLAGTMVFFLVFYNVFAGVRSVDREMVNLAPVLGANERQLGRQIYLPATAPFLLLGMRMAIPYAVIGVIVGEFTASTAGLGLFINYASSTYDPAGVFAGIFIQLGFVMTMSAVADRIERRILRWRPSTYTPSGDAA